MSWQQFETYHYKSDRKRSWGYTSSSRHTNNESYDDQEEVPRNSKKFKKQTQHNSRGERDYDNHTQPNYNRDYNRHPDRRDSPSYYGSSKQQKENPSDIWNKKEKEMWVDNEYNQPQKNWKGRRGRYSDENSADEEVERQVRLVANDDNEERNFRQKNHSPISFISSVKTIANEKYQKKEKVEIIRKSRVEKITSITRQMSEQGNAIPTITNYSVNKIPKNRTNQNNYKILNIFSSTDYDHKGQAALDKQNSDPRIRSSSNEQSQPLNESRSRSSTSSSHKNNEQVSIEMNEQDNFTIKQTRPHTSRELNEMKNTFVQSIGADNSAEGYSAPSSSNKPIKLLTSEQKLKAEESFVDDCKTIANVGQIIMNEIDDNAIKDQVLRAMKNAIDKLAIGHIQNILKE